MLVIIVFVFYSGMDASNPEIFYLFLLLIHSHYSCRPSGDCGGSRDRTWNCCVAVWFTQSRLSQLSHHIKFSLYITLIKGKLKTNRGQKWYQSKAYALGLGRLGFILHFKGPWPLKFK
jgi:hypothetical protein